MWPCGCQAGVTRARERLADTAIRRYCTERLHVARRAAVRAPTIRLSITHGSRRGGIRWVIEVPATNVARPGPRRRSALRPDWPREGQVWAPGNLFAIVRRWCPRPTVGRVGAPPRRSLPERESGAHAVHLADALCRRRECQATGEGCEAGWHRGEKRSLGVAATNATAPRHHWGAVPRAMPSW